MANQGTDSRFQWASLAVSTLPALAAVFALVFTWQTVAQTRDELKVAESGQITDRFNDAITNLGSKSQDVRLGGIYASQRIMNDSTRDQPSIVSVLSAFIRGHDNPPARCCWIFKSPPSDVQAALDVLSARDFNHDGSARVDLAGAILDGTDFSNHRFTNARLQGASLVNAVMVDSDLRKADLTTTNLQSAVLANADLRSAELESADLCGTNLTGADLRGAHLARVDLRHAQLRDADLRNASLFFADLRGADLEGADLRGAELQGVKRGKSSMSMASGYYIDCVKKPLYNYTSGH